MAAYHQMGHNSENLLFESGLSSFRGAILSPVNADPPRTVTTVARIREELPDGFDVVLDPQLYVPATQRGMMRRWAYVPNDVDTADLSSLQWWANVNSTLLRQAIELNVSTICSPATLPRADDYSDGYYAHCIEVGNDLCDRAALIGTRVLQTAVVGLRQLALVDRPLQVASILSNTKSSEIYLVFFCDLVPRRELTGSEELTGACRLISELKRSGLEVIVGYCAADMVLWKAAGATSCATGKFFNLRRFDGSRWQAASDGGQNVAYFFEEALLAFLREADVRRIRDRGMLSPATAHNPFAQTILEGLNSRAGEAWVGNGWRQFLYWFADCETRLSHGERSETIVRVAETMWGNPPPDGRPVLMEEARNDGSWVRPWLISLVEGTS